MDNSKILQLLESHRDQLFKKLNGLTISKLYKQEYQEIKSGRIFVFDNKERQLLSDLKKLSKDTSNDNLIANKLNDFLSLDNEVLIDYFKAEFEKVLDKIMQSNKKDEIQALFIEYDYYYHFTSCIECYGQQEYPIIEVPRYITSEYDYNKQILFLDNGINFHPAWIDCEELANFDYLDINYELETLFQNHSRILLHRALKKLEESNRLSLFKNRPFTFYINEHDCEVMMLFRLK
jgi:hypothetical protein